MSRIALVIHSLGGGGAERVATQLTGYWSETGRDVTLITIAGPDRVVYPVDPRVKVVHLDLDAPSRGPIHGATANFKRYRALRAELIRIRPDIAIGFMSTAAVLVAFAARGLGVRTVGCERNFPPALPLGRLWERLRAIAYGRLDLVLAQTQAAADWLSRHTGARRTAVIANAIPWPLVDSAPTVDPDAVVPAGAKVILAAGRLDAQKGFDVLIEAFAAVAAARPDWRLVILGEGALRPDLAAASERLGVGDRVHMPGRVGNVSTWYRRADIFCLSSRFEGFPNVLLEALASGVAAIATDCDQGPREIITPLQNGLLSPPEDPSALAEGLGRLMDDPALRARLAAAGPDVIERFSTARIMAAWDDVLGTLARAEPVKVGQEAA